MKEIIIFGIGKIADVIQYYMREESGMPVKAFTVDRQFMEGNSFQGLPVIPFEEIQEAYPPESYDMFVAVGYQDMNRLRQQKMHDAEEKGYHLTSYVHPNSTIPGDLVHGKNCFIMNNVCIHPRVSIGEGVFVWSGAMIGHHSTVGNYNWFTSSANVGGNVTMGDNCFLAMNATVSHSVKLGNAIFLGANALVTKDLGDDKVVISESHKPIKLNTKQFLRMSGFSNL